ncbi:hypothetical protein [Streptomyces roseolus]|uniref:hypothetical protein n=1 Tax=Streptomyces roseolus TaxID=67358 RepID=UPI00378A1234
MAFSLIRTASMHTPQPGEYVESAWQCWDDQQRFAAEEVDFRRRAADAETLLGEREAGAEPAHGREAGTVPGAGGGTLRSELTAIDVRARRAPSQ